MEKRIAILPGDGIGAEVMAEAIRVLKAVEQRFGHVFHLEEQPVGGTAYDLAGTPLPAETLRACAAADAILFGSVGGPQWDTLPPELRPETGALLPLRKHFDLFANIRPAGVLPELKAFSPLKDRIIGEGFDFVVIRELTGDVYFGAKGGDGTSFASDLMLYQRHEVERIARVAFALARTRHNKVTNVDKANVLATSRFWRAVVEELHQKEFADVTLEHLYIDNATMQILTRPGDFDVIVTGNLFGDILSDEAAQISGSIGMQASASVNDNNFGLYEPMGGSAPDIAGKGIANPIAQINSLAMLLEISFGMKTEAQMIKNAVTAALAAGLRTGDIYTEGMKKVGTEEMGKAIAEFVAQS